MSLRLRHRLVGQALQIEAPGLGQTVDLPARGKRDGEVIGKAVRETEEQRLRARNVLEGMFFGSSEQPGRKHRMSTRELAPARHGQIKLRYQRRVGGIPVGLVGEVHLDARRYEAPHIVFQEGTPIRIVLVALLEPAPGGFHAGVGHGYRPRQRALVEFERCLALDSRVSRGWDRRRHERSAVLVQPQRGHAGLHPRQQAEGREGNSGIHVQILAVELHDHDVGIEQRRVHQRRIEEVAVARRDQHRVCLEACRARQAQHQPGNLQAIAAPARQHVLHIVGCFLLLARPFLFGFLAIIRDVMDLLRARVQLAQLRLR